MSGIFYKISYRWGEKKPRKWGWEGSLCKWDGNGAPKLILFQNGNSIT